MTEETWKAAPGYEGLYEVSDLGRVRRLIYVNKQTCRRYDEPRIIKLSNNHPWYLTVTLSKSSKHRTFRVHSLVLLTFVGPRPAKEHGCHINGQPHDNRLANLRWAPQTQNEADKVRHGTVPYGTKSGTAKLSDAIVADMKRRMAAGVKDRVLAEEAGVEVSTVRLIRWGKTWRHVDAALPTPAVKG